MIAARANIAALAPQFDSKAEAWWDKYGALLVAQEYGQPVALTQYHPVTFRLPGETYTPDFLHVMADGALIFIEVKGSAHQRNYRDARSKLRSAAEVFAWAAFYETIVNGKGCEKLERIGG